MNTRALSPIAGLLATAALLAAPQAHALYNTLDPVAAVSELSITSYSVVGGTAQVSLASPLPAILFNGATGAPGSTINSYNVLSTQVNAAGTVISETRQYFTTQTYSQMQSIGFTLSGMSVATFDARLLAGTWSSASVNESGQSISEVLPGVYSRSVSAYAALVVSGAPFNANAYPQYSDASTSANGWADDHGLYQSGVSLASGSSSDGPILSSYNLVGHKRYVSLGFMNLTGANIQGTLQLSTFTSVTNYNSPIVVQVPEADTALLALAGLGVVGLVSRRRRVR